MTICATLRSSSPDDKLQTAVTHRCLTTSLAPIAEMNITTPPEVQITFTDVSSTTRRLRFRRREQGDWWRTEAVWNGCQWRPVGREHVTDLEWQSESGGGGPLSE
jgi:hypothetical protein